MRCPSVFLRVLGFLFWSAVLSTAAGAATRAQADPLPAMLPLPDPLRVAPPYSVRVRAPERSEPARMSTELMSRLVSRGEGDVIDIIIELHEYELVTEPGTARPTLRELVAAAAHGFMQNARDADIQILLAEALPDVSVIHALVRKEDLSRLSDLRGVRSIQSNFPVQGARVEGKQLVQAVDLAARYGVVGRGVGIAVIDSGMDASHPELAGRVIAGASYAGDGDPFNDANGHGTAVAGIAAGTNGVAPGANLISVEVLDAEGRGDAFALLQAANAVYAARAEFGIRVVNVSLTFPDSHYSRDCDRSVPDGGLLKKMFQAGMHVVVAAGNEASGGLGIPACHSKVLAVGAIYDGEHGPQAWGVCADPITYAGLVPCYSNSGPPLDVLAPSHFARTLAPGGAYVEDFGGTSAAAPYVSGLVAQILSGRSRTTPLQMRTAFSSTGAKIKDPANGLVRRLANGPSAYQKLGGKPTRPEGPVP